MRRALASCLALASFGCDREPKVTFSEHVAPVVYARCAPCHHDGQVAPFPLLTEADVVDHAEQIVEVTASRFMPPWKPVGGRFFNDRSLAPAEIDVFRRWVDAGMASGPASALPTPPTFAQGWVLGRPSAIAEMTESFTVPAEGGDVYRNFVIRAPVDRPVWVRAWELDPGNARVVHHAIVNVDRNGSARAKDRDDPGPGFEAMEFEGAQSPGGFYLVWAPGNRPSAPRQDVSWPLAPGTDLVLQLHLQPTGKPEPVRAKVALYFADAPPKRRGLTLRVGDVPIDIAPGDPSYEITDRLELAADVELLSVFPHAHYLGKRFHVTARLPDRSTRELLRIDDWDFSWQDQYRYAPPVRLPAGSVIDLRISYDNSPGNPRNPSRPPRRVRSGPESTDEMGNVTFEAVPIRAAGLEALRESKYRRAVERAPSATAHFNLGNALWRRRQLEAASEQYRAALELDGAHSFTLHNLTMVLLEAGKGEEALATAERHVEAHPREPMAHNDLGNALRVGKRVAQAKRAFHRALELDPSFAVARDNLERLEGERSR